MEKVIKDGKVAILFSPGFGAGWYTLNKEYPELIFHPEIVRAVLDGDKQKAAKIASRICPNCVTLGAEELEVMWLDEGTEFEIDEFDGSESVHFIGSRGYMIA